MRDPTRTRTPAPPASPGLGLWLLVAVAASIALLAAAGPAARPPPPAVGGGGPTGGAALRDAIESARGQGEPPKRAGGGAESCPVFVDGARTLVPCPASGGPYECRGSQGCVAAGARDGRRVERRNGTASGDVIGNCTLRGANGTRSTAACALACGRKRCPAGSGWIYGCSAGRCVRTQRAASPMARAGSVGCAGDLRRDACGVCGGRGRDLCGNCPANATAAPCASALPADAAYVDAVVPGTDDALAIVDKLSNLTGLSPDLFVVTSRVAAPEARRSRSALQTSSLDSVVVAIAAPGANETADLLVEASLTGASPYDVRNLADVAADAGNATSASEPIPVPTSTPTATTGSGSGSPAAPSPPPSGAPGASPSPSPAGGAGGDAVASGAVGRSPASAFAALAGLAAFALAL